MLHIPVLLHEVIEGLDIKPTDVVLDGTINRGGHSKALCAKLGSEGILIGMDRDEAALAEAEKNLATCKAKTIFINDNFKNFDLVLAKNNLSHVDKIILDIGLSSNQLEQGGRGFSFQHDEQLLMTFKTKPGEGDVTAWNVVNEWGEESLTTIIEGFGEERFAKRIAKGIITRREEKPIATSKELAEVIKKSVPRWYVHRKVHPATKTFQAIRIAVNEELTSLEEVLPKSMQYLSSGGRIGIISFHSLEDRIVKKFFKYEAGNGMCKIITKKPLAPSMEEILANPRARSAKLRIAEKI